MKIKYSNPQKPHPWRKTPKHRVVTIHPPVRLVGDPKKTKKRKEGRKKDTQNSGKLGIHPDHPRRRIKIKLCMVGGWRCVVIHVKCDPNRSRGYVAVGVENGPSPLLWPVAYTTACTVTMCRKHKIPHNSCVFNILADRVTIQFSQCYLG